MSLTDDDIQRILKIIDELEYGEIRLEYGSLKLYVRKNGDPRSEVGVVEAGEASGFGPASGEGDPVSLPAEELSQPTSASMVGAFASANSDEAEIVCDALCVRAPIQGVFYRAPGTGVEPFVELGDSVEPNDTVGLLEVMKLYTSVEAGVAGRVTHILVDNGATVDKGEALMLVEPRDA